VATRVFGTRRGRITLTDEMLTYEQRGHQQRRVNVLRSHITEVYLVSHAHWFTPPWTEVVVWHSSGSLSIPHVGRRAAEALRAALEF
jgi:hypothetical protein